MTTELKRAGICIDVTKPEEVRGIEEWFRKWKPALSHVSEDEGCGCCVEIWHVEGPEEAIREIPKGSTTFNGGSDYYWDEYDAR